MIWLAVWANHELSDYYFSERVIPIIAKYEGTQFTNNPKDPGGPTKYGWTLQSYKAMVNPNANIDTIKNLSSSQAMKSYKDLFWNKYGSSKINDRELGVTLLLAQINLGPTRPNRVLQRMDNKMCHSNLSLDGILGKKSILSINKCKYLWPGYPYILYYFYSNSKSIAPVWKWAKKGLKTRILHGITTN